MENILISILAPLVGLWLGSIEVRMRDIDKRLQNVPTRSEVSNEIDAKQEVIKVLQKEIKEDIRDLKTAIEKLVEKNS